MNGSSKKLTSAVTAALLACSTPGFGLSFEFQDGEWTLDLDTIVSYSAQWRVDDPDRDAYGYKDTGDLIADSTRYTIFINATDGNYNFDSGLVKNKISVVSEMDLSRGDFGVFARAPPKPPPQKPSRQEQCVICQETIGSAGERLPCAHVFHRACLERWLAEKQWCPVCRTPV